MKFYIYFGAARGPDDVWSKLRIYLAFCKGAVRHALTFSRGIKIKVKKLFTGAYLANVSKWQVCCTGVILQNSVEGVVAVAWNGKSLAFRQNQETNFQWAINCCVGPCLRNFTHLRPTCISCGNVSNCLRAAAATACGLFIFEAKAPTFLRWGSWIKCEHFHSSWLFPIVIRTWTKTSFQREIWKWKIWKSCWSSAWSFPNKEPLWKKYKKELIDGSLNWKSD